MTLAFPSPCVGLCETAPDGLCKGCARTGAEIKNWQTFTPQEKAAVFQELPERRARTGYGSPVLGHPLAVLDRFLLESLDDPKALWSVGVPGAMAVFSPADGQGTISPRLWEYGGYVVGAYGGVRVVLDHKAKKIKAIGTVDPATGLVSQVDLCLYVSKAVMSQRTVLTEVGQDPEALRVRDRPGILFDLGLGIAHLDYCVRIEDEALIRQLREVAGRSVFEDGSPVPALLSRETQAQRVVLTRLGRIEIWGAVTERDCCDDTATNARFDGTIFTPGVDRPADSPVPKTLCPIISLTPGRPLRLS